MAEVLTDSSGNEYIEIALANEEKIRVTMVPDSWTGGEGVRIQMRAVDGHLRQGPEIPASSVGDLVAAVIALIRRG